MSLWTIMSKVRVEACMWVSDCNLSVKYYRTYEFDTMWTVSNWYYLITGKLIKASIGWVDAELEIGAKIN